MPWPLDSTCCEVVSRCRMFFLIRDFGSCRSEARREPHAASSASSTSQLHGGILAASWRCFTVPCVGHGRREGGRVCALDSMFFLACELSASHCPCPTPAACAGGPESEGTATAASLFEDDFEAETRTVSLLLSLSSFLVLRRAWRSSARPGQRQRSGFEMEVASRCGAVFFSESLHRPCKGVTGYPFGPVCLLKHHDLPATLHFRMTVLRTMLLHRLSSHVGPGSV